MNTTSIAILNLWLESMGDWGDPAISLAQQLKPWFPPGIEDYQLFYEEIQFNISGRGRQRASAREAHQESISKVLGKWTGVIMEVCVSFRPSNFIDIVRGERLELEESIV